MKLFIKIFEPFLAVSKSAIGKFGENSIPFLLFESFENFKQQFYSKMIDSSCKNRLVKNIALRPCVGANWFKESTKIKVGRSVK